MVKIDVDLCNQIHNEWSRDSVIGAVSDENKDFHFSVRIRYKSKEILRKKFIVEPRDEDTRIANRKVVAIIYSYMLYKLMSSVSGKVKSCDFRICPDHRPVRDVDYFLQVIFRLTNRPKTNYSFRSGDGKSSAHNKTIEVFRGRKNADYVIDDRDMKELQAIINEIKEKYV